MRRAGVARDRQHCGQPGRKHIGARRRQSGHGASLGQRHRAKAGEHGLQLGGRNARLGIVDRDAILGGENRAGDRHCATSADERSGARGIEIKLSAAQRRCDGVVDAAPFAWAEGLAGVGHAALGQTHATERKTCGLAHAPFAKLEALETAAAEVENEKVAPPAQRRFGGETAADEVGFFGAGENAQIMATGGGADSLAQFRTVGCVAHRAGRDDGEALGRKSCGFAQEPLDGVEGGRDSGLGQPRFVAADSGADARFVGGREQHAQVTVFVEVGDEEFDRIAADIDDGYRRAHTGRHATRLARRPSSRRRAKMFRQAAVPGPESAVSMGIGALFDWDGVIIDSARQHAESWERLAREERRALPENHFKIGFGMKNERIIPGLLRWTDDPAEIRRLSLRKEALYREIVVAEGTAPLPGVREFLDRLADAGVPCAIGSSTHRENIDTILALIGLGDRFAHIVTAEDVGHGKPDPEVFLKGAAGIGREPAECIVFEDAITGLEAARRGGMRAVGVATTHPAGSLGLADRVVHRLDELTVADLVALVHGPGR